MKKIVAGKSALLSAPLLCDESWTCVDSSGSIVGNQWHMESDVWYLHGQMCALHLRHSQKQGGIRRNTSEGASGASVNHIKSNHLSQAASCSAGEKTACFKFATKAPLNLKPSSLSTRCRITTCEHAALEMKLHWDGDNAFG